MTTRAVTVALLVAAFDIGCSIGGGDLAVAQARGGQFRDYFLYCRRRTSWGAVLVRVPIACFRFRLPAELRLVRRQRRVIRLALAGSESIEDLMRAIDQEHIERQRIVWGTQLDPSAIGKLASAIESGFSTAVLTSKFQQKRLRAGRSGEITAIAPWRLKVLAIGVPALILLWLLSFGWFAFSHSYAMLAGWVMLSIASCVHIGRTIWRALSDDIAIAIALRSVKKLRGI